MIRKKSNIPAFLEILASLIYLGVAWLIWINVSQNTLGTYAPFLWGIGTVSAINLLFVGLAGFIWGWTPKMVDEAPWCVRISAVAFFAVAAGYSDIGVLPLQGGIGFPTGVIEWVWYTIIAFAIGWLGLAHKELVK